MKALDLLAGLDRAQLDKETERIYEVCDGCRRCFNLCPSFNTLLEGIDQHDGDVTRLTAGEREQVVEECYYCKLCYNHCPYTPPHRYAIDFPHLMVAWKRQHTQEKGARWRDRLLIQTDRLGRLGSRVAPLANWALRSKWVRKLMEAAIGIDHRRQTLPYASEPFPRWWRRQRRQLSDGSNGKVAVFVGCLINWQATDIGKATVQVLEKNRVEVVVPPQRCCGMPLFDVGDLTSMVNAAKANCESLRPWIEQGYDVIAPVPSCSLMLKREYPALVPNEEMMRLAQHTYDVCEYLMRLKKAGKLATDFVRNPGWIAYQVPCHLRDQNIGFKSKELMELTGARVEVIERCSGHDGAWSAKTEFFDRSMAIAQKAVRAMADVSPTLTASDCPLAALQLDQAGATGTAGCATLHPIQIIRDAYGLPA